mmetsp:Transcript_15317/g.36531  ORF Transcript_15317/g.36531 Transcript_15317/m.36531 type:complete len:250 (+) Transcript_15317:1237-1986(+)
MERESYSPMMSPIFMASSSRTARMAAMVAIIPASELRRFRRRLTSSVKGSTLPFTITSRFPSLSLRPFATRFSVAFSLLPTTMTRLSLKRLLWSSSTPRILPRSLVRSSLRKRTMTRTMITTCNASRLPRRRSFRSKKKRKRRRRRKKRRKRRKKLSRKRRRRRSMPGMVRIPRRGRLRRWPRPRRARAMPSLALLRANNWMPRPARGKARSIPPKNSVSKITYLPAHHRWISPSTLSCPRTTTILVGA